MGTVIGCDISKERIDVQVLSAAARRRAQLANREGAIGRWVGQLPAGCCVGMEATGTLHEPLARALFEGGHTVYVLNPRWVYAYRRALGLRGKTDQVDAAVIARYIDAEAKNLHAYQPPSPEQAELRRLLLRRLELKKLMGATRQSLGAQARSVLEQFGVLLREIELRIAALIAANAEWRALAQRLRSIPGVGPIVSAHLVQVLTRISFGSAQAFIAHTGTDPRPNDSGQKQGRRRLTHHGDVGLRHMLFLAAMAASKLPEWRALYEHHRNKSLPSTAVFIVLARKLARIAFHLFKTGEIYDPTRLGGAQPA
jgi:transposase